MHLNRTGKISLVIIGAVGLTALGLFSFRSVRAGLDWEVQPPPESYQQSKGTPVRFNAVDFIHIDNKNYGWIVGNVQAPSAGEPHDTLLYYNGSYWQAPTPAPFFELPQDLLDVDAAYDLGYGSVAVWAVGNEGRYWFLDSGITQTCKEVWGEESGAYCDGPITGSDLLSVAAFIQTDHVATVFISDSDGNIWKRRYSLFRGPTSEPWEPTNLGSPVTDLYALDENTVWAVTEDGRILKWTGTGNNWVQQGSFSGISFSGITATDAERAWAVGKNGSDKGVIYALSGGSWGQDATLKSGNDLPPLNAVDAIQNADLGLDQVFAVGDVSAEFNNNGAMLQYNGSRWERKDSNNDEQPLYGVAAASLTQVRAVGDRSTIIVSTPGNIFGWLWFGGSNGDNSLDSLGWASGSCANQDWCDTAGFAYGIQVARSGTNIGAISGYAWLGAADPAAYKVGDCAGGGVCGSNPSVSCSNDTECACSRNPKACQASGWLSFNKLATDGVATESGTPPAEPYSGAEPYLARYDPGTGKISGWARLLSLKADSGGWIKLRGDEITASTAGPYGECKNCLGADCSICNEAVVGGQRTVVSCNTCTGCTQRCQNNLNTICTEDADCVSPDTCLDAYYCDSCLTCDRYGLSIDESTGKVTGYGWSGNQTGGSELGWVDFSRSNYYSQAWLQTNFGDIYAQGDIGSTTTPNPPSGKCNAFYLLSAAGTIQNFCTKAGTIADPGPIGTGSDRPFSQQNYDPLYFPYASSDYTNILGRLDIDGLIDPVGATDRNKYGQTVETVGAPGQTTILADLGWCTNTAIKLDNKVYHIQGDLDLSPCEYQPGETMYQLDISAGSPSGNDSGTIVVDGKLNININMSYIDSGGTLRDISELPSLGVIVQDTMVIGQDVNNLVGSYLVLGPVPVTASPGIEITNSVQESPFQAHGLFVARSFKFGRTYRGTLLDPLPAESITYDGRVVANPPPGFRDLSKALPTLRETVP